MMRPPPKNNSLSTSEREHKSSLDTVEIRVFHIFVTVKMIVVVFKHHLDKFVKREVCAYSDRMEITASDAQ